MTKEFSYSYGDYFADDKYSRMRFDISRDLLKNYIHDGVKILDIGCYDAAMLEVLKSVNTNIDYLGIDSDLPALEKAKKRGADIGVINLENASWPFKPESFDIVILAEILEHLRDPALVMEKAKMFLKPVGMILISLPNECNLFQRIKVLFGLGIDGTGFAPGYHLHFPTIGQNKSFVSEYFKILQTRYWHHLGNAGLLSKALEMIPKPLVNLLLKISPSLFARGVIYLCQK